MARGKSKAETLERKRVLREKTRSIGTELDVERILRDLRSSR